MAKRKVLISGLVATTMLSMNVKATTIVASGEDCGTNCSWSIDDEGKLSVWATDSDSAGSIANYNNKYTSGIGWHSDAPWGSYTNEITSVHIAGDTPESKGISSIGNTAFRGLKGVTGTLTVPDSVTYIGTSAFSEMAGVEKLSIGNSVETIGENAFYYMTGVTGTLTIPNSVTSIGSSAFLNMTGVTGTLTIPNSVTSIGDGAFRGMAGVEKLSIGNSVETIEEKAFSGLTGVTGALVIPDSVTSIGNSAFLGMRGVTSLTIPDSVTSIGEFAFQNMTSVTGALVIPDSVTSIGDYAFSEMPGVTSLTIPDSVTSIGSRVLWGVTGLQTLTASPSILSSLNMADLIDGGEYQSALNSLESIEQWLASNPNDTWMKRQKASAEAQVAAARENLANSTKKIQINCTGSDEACSAAVVVPEAYKTVMGDDYYPFIFGQPDSSGDSTNRTQLSDGSYRIVDENGKVRYEGKRIYTLKEANEVAKSTGNTVKIRYR